MQTLLKVMPILVLILSICLNGLLTWVAWSLRQLAKQEVAAAIKAFQQIVNDSEARLAAADRKVNQDVDNMDTRITRMEERFEALPQQADFKRLEGVVGAIGRELSAHSALLGAVKESNHATQSAVDRLYRFQLENSR